MKLQMGIIKIEIKLPELKRTVEVFRENPKKAFEEISQDLKSVLSETFNQLLQAEMDIFLGNPDQKLNKKNGVYERQFAIKGIGALRLRMPTDRHRKFESQIAPKNEQIDSRLKEDLAILHLAGISNRMVALISKRVLGIKVSPQTVYNSLAVVEEKALEFFDRKIDKKYWALFVDGTNFKVQRRGSTEKEPTLAVIGIDDSNRMSVLALQGGYKDISEAWGVVFQDLINRGLKPELVQIGVMDGLPGLESKFKEYFPKSQTGRCWVHAKNNAILKCPARMRDALAKLIESVMYAKSEADARAAFHNLKQQLQSDAIKSVNCLEKDLESLLTHYKFEKQFWRTLRTTNPIERVNKELKRRTKTMEGVGEKTLNIILAFTAMRLEYYWHQMPVDSVALNNLTYIKKQNQTDDVLENLIH